MNNKKIPINSDDIKESDKSTSEGRSHNIPKNTVVVNNTLDLLLKDSDEEIMSSSSDSDIEDEFNEKGERVKKTIKKKKKKAFKFSSSDSRDMEGVLKRKRLEIEGGDSIHEKLELENMKKEKEKLEKMTLQLKTEIEKQISVQEKPAENPGDQKTLDNFKNRNIARNEYKLKLIELRKEHNKEILNRKKKREEDKVELNNVIKKLENMEKRLDISKRLLDMRLKKYIEEDDIKKKKILYHIRKGNIKKLKNYIENLGFRERINEVKCEEKFTALHTAVNYNRIKIVKYLFERCPNIKKNYRNIHGLTPIHIAALQNYEELFDLLVVKGCKWKIKLGVKKIPQITDSKYIKKRYKEMKKLGKEEKNIKKKFRMSLKKDEFKNLKEQQQRINN